MEYFKDRKREKLNTQIPITSLQKIFQTQLMSLCSLSFPFRGNHYLKAGLHWSCAFFTTYTCFPRHCILFSIYFQVYGWIQVIDTLATSFLLHNTAVFQICLYCYVSSTLFISNAEQYSTVWVYQYVVYLTTIVMVFPLLEIILQ